MNDKTETYTKEEVDAYSKEQFAEMLEGEGAEGFDGVLDELYTIPDLRTLAGKNEINLQGRDKKADIITSIREWATPSTEETGSDAASADETSEVSDVDGDATSDDTEEDSNDESDDVSELGDDSPSDVGDGEVPDEDVQVLELHEALNALQDEYKAAVKSLSRELDECKAEIASLQKALKVKPKDATLHGSIDNL